VWVTAAAICCHRRCLPLFMRVVLLQCRGGRGRKLLAAEGVGFKFNRVNFPGREDFILMLLLLWNVSEHYNAHINFATKFLAVVTLTGVATQCAKSRVPIL
jgi:hypothetical protein